VLFLGIGLSIGPPLEFFSVDALDFRVFVHSQLLLDLKIVGKFSINFNENLHIWLAG